MFNGMQQKDYSEICIHNFNTEFVLESSNQYSAIIINSGASVSHVITINISSVSRGTYYLATVRSENSGRAWNDACYEIWFIKLQIAHSEQIKDMILITFLHNHSHFRNNTLRTNKNRYFNSWTIKFVRTVLLMFQITSPNGKYYILFSPSDS
jgi:hypothetical protein